MDYKAPFIVCLLVFFLPVFAFSQVDKKIDSLKQIVKHVPENNKIKKAFELISLGQQYVNKSDYTSGMDCYQQSLDMAQRLNNDSLTANSYRHIALIAFSQQNYYKDSVYDAAALKIYRKINDKLNEGKVLKDIGSSYLNRGALPEAKKYYGEALFLFKQLNQQRLVAGIYAVMAVIYKNDYRKSIELELAAKKIWDKYPTDDASSLINTGNLGVAYFYMVRYDSLKSIKPDSIIPASPSKNLKIAGEYIRQAIQIAKHRNDIENEAYYTEILSELQYHNGDYKGAYDNFYFYQNVNDSIFSQQNKNKIAELESRNEIQKKNAEILNQKIRAQTQQRNMLLLLAGFLAMLIIGGLFYRLSVVRKQKNVELTKLNGQLDDANKLKAKFFAILTHDLRSPISSLVNFFQLQKRDSKLLSEEQKAEQESKITQSALSLLKVMEEILLWSKGQMENFKPNKAPIPIANLYAYLQNFFPAVSSVKFNYFANEGLSVYTDENYLKTIMQNLTQNSINAMKGTGERVISWKAWNEGNAIKLSITDNGPGMSAEQIKKFEENITIGSSKQGLGLSLVKDMAQTIGCTIALHSKEGSGTTFTLTIGS
ncbi:tetratricopeptide repeat-containing sensor histidine kinase [Mucilaginibacter sp.]|uniref:tetratricopeptide repeat-containing sensor histidine kinase n=1 Tax=Mucilaginibacter sp. TaxID=1882438 RepID=UPI00284D5EB0|nr:tetratricopeptide repeat-containing sensor histidine kinase [Mucilaginibacter sp.]MDR3692997.1 tetratricopeptide repeat-containing sensor histidine kinase [Mucilaginibacter sp.]